MLQTNWKTELNSGRTYGKASSKPIKANSSKKKRWMRESNLCCSRNVAETFQQKRTPPGTNKVKRPRGHPSHWNKVRQPRRKAKACPGAGQYFSKKCKSWLPRPGYEARKAPSNRATLHKRDCKIR